MKIGLIGYGKMGRAIEQIAQANGDVVAWRITAENHQTLGPALFNQVDVVIEFTAPSAGFTNVMACLEAGVPVVSGTTGWQNRLHEAKDFCHEKEGTMLWSSNFSVGVNLFFLLNQYLANLMVSQQQYGVSMTETHHTQKLDAPSGTAVTLAEQILSAHLDKFRWVLHPTVPSENEISITSIRKDAIPGTHEICWDSEEDRIVIAHEAKNRLGFARGALLAAHWLLGKKGIFSMQDVIFEKIAKQ